MPSPPDRRLCIFGDSQLAAMRRAEALGLLPLGGYAVEYWGASGPRFRQLEWQDGRVVATRDAHALALQINGNGRSSLGAEDFDEILIFGARVRANEFIAAYLHRALAEHGWQSPASLRLAARQFLINNRAYRFARDLAARGKARISVIPAPFSTDGVIDHHAQGQIFDLFPGAEAGTGADRAPLWDVLETEAARDGVTFLRQPDASVTRGVLTDARFGVEDARALKDYGHKSPEYAAMMFEAYQASCLGQAA